MQKITAIELFKRVRNLAGERDQLQTAAKNKDGILQTAPVDMVDVLK